MRICFYAPFKPLGHVHPSGDLVIATGLFDYLAKRGHSVRVVSSLRSRWIFWKPWRWPQIPRDRRRALRRLSGFDTDLWLTYHTYYKAPDLLGPSVARRLGIPYVIFQGIYSTKRKRDFRTWPGYVLNKKALTAARHVFTNRGEDLLNLRRLLPEDRLTYVPPGIHPHEFYFDADARAEMRRSWNVGHEPVVLSAAMFRPGVKTEGLAWVIRVCGEILRQGRNLHLVIAGDGKEKARLLKLAEAQLPGKVRFVGQVSREKMYRFYSAGDMFVFPGIRESLGMVFLEAQSCGLPAIAFADGGIPEVVKAGETGLLLPLYDFQSFVQAAAKLLADKVLRRNMGRAARVYVCEKHDLNKNYGRMERVLKSVARSVGPRK